MSDCKVFFVTFSTCLTKEGMDRTVKELSDAVVGTELDGAKFVPLPFGVSLMKYDSEKPAWA